jgi:hypothetical protein
VHLGTDGEAHAAAAEGVRAADAKPRDQPPGCFDKPAHDAGKAQAQEKRQARCLPSLNG